MTLADYVEVLRRRKWVIIQAAIIAPVIGVVLALQQSTFYRALAEVLLNRQDLAGQIVGIQDPTLFQDPDRIALTQATLAESPVVARRAAKIANSADITPALALKNTRVQASPDADLLLFSTVSRDPKIAPKLATAYAKAYTQYRREIDTAGLKTAQRQLGTRLEQLRGSGREDTALYSNLLEKQQQLQTLELLKGSDTLVRPAIGASKVGPPIRRNVVLGLLFGLFVGATLAFVWEALDRRIRDAEEVEEGLGVPLLARLPAPDRRDERLTILDRPLDDVTEAVSRLRANFDFVNRQVHAKLVMVTSAGAKEGKSTTATNLGVSLARTGRTVVLVDLDLRRPALARMFHLVDRLGVTDVVSGQVDLDAVLNPLAHSFAGTRTVALHEAEASAGVLEVVTAGRARFDPAELIEHPMLAEILHSLRSRADIVLIDAPPLLATGDAMALTAKVDAILLINRLGTLTRLALRDLARALGRSPAPTIGLVATGAPAEMSYYSYRADQHVATDVPTLRAQAGRQASLEETSERDASAAGGRWGRPSQ
jgi:capsular exopolysaccharide synthesis family protein